MRRLKLATTLHAACLFIFLVLGLISCGGSSLTLPTDYDKANEHMAGAIEYKNQFTRWMNGLSEQKQPSTDEWLGALGLLERAIAEAKLVSQDFLSLAHPELPELWQGFFIPSMEGTHLYYFNAVTNPDSVKLPSTDEGMKQVNRLIDAQTLDNLWGEWYDAHRDSIRTGIRKLAE